MKKINFNDKFNLARAILEGRKTQTRRIVSESLIDDYDNWLNDVMCIAAPAGTTYEKIEDFLIKRSRYRVGEIVAVAQSYEVVSDNISQTPSKERAEFYCKIMKTCYPKDETPRDKEDIAGWNNKMFVKAELMPHQIRIANVRIERLQDISDDDCLAEGIERLPEGGGNKPYAFYDNSIRVKSEKEGIHYGSYRDFNTPREAYAALIDKVGKKGDWGSNPYVFVYDFELIK